MRFTPGSKQKHDDLKSKNCFYSDNLMWKVPCADLGKPELWWVFILSICLTPTLFAILIVSCMIMKWAYCVLPTTKVTSELSLPVVELQHQISIEHPIVPYTAKWTKLEHARLYAQEMLSTKFVSGELSVRKKKTAGKCNRRPSSGGLEASVSRRTQPIRLLRRSFFYLCDYLHRRHKGIVQRRTENLKQRKNSNSVVNCKVETFTLELLKTSIVFEQICRKHGMRKRFSGSLQN